MKPFNKSEKTEANPPRESRWISLCVTLLTVAAVAISVYQVLRAPGPDSAPSATTETTPTAPEPSPEPEQPAATAVSPVTTAPMPTPQPAAESPAPTDTPEPAPTPTPAITPPANSGSPVSDSNIVLSPGPLPTDIQLN